MNDRFLLAADSAPALPQVREKGCQPDPRLAGSKLYFDMHSGRMVDYPDAEMNRGDKTQPDQTFSSVQTILADAPIVCGCWT